MKRSWIFASLLAAGLVAQGAHAAVITLDLTTTNPDLSACATGNTPGGTRGCLENGDTATTGGLTATFSSVTPLQTGFSYIVVDEDGIRFDSDVLGTPDTTRPAAGSFGISFSQDVYIKKYVVGFDTTTSGGVGNSGGFNIANLGLNNMFGTLREPQDFVNPNYRFTAGTVYTVDGTATDLATLKSLTVETVAAVPEPGTLALLGLGIAGLGLSRRRKAA